MDGEEKKGGLIELPDIVKKQLNTLQDRGTVIAIGATCWQDENQPRAKVGDRVIVTRMAGYVAAGEDGELYRFVNDRDIFARLSGEVAHG